MTKTTCIFQYTVNGRAVHQMIDASRKSGNASYLFTTPLFDAL